MAQKDALYSGIPRNHERAQNKPPDCKTRTAAPTGIGSGGETGKLTSNSGVETYSTDALATRFPIRWPTVQWLRAQGVPIETVARMASIVCLRGRRGDDGWFDENPEGNVFLAFYEEAPEDLVLWSPRTGELATWCGRAFALGEDNIAAAMTYAFDCYLHIYADPLEWLRDKGRGIVVLDWSRAFDMLRHAPRVAVTESLLPTYRKAMTPQRMPELAVLANSTMRAAA